MGKSSLFGIRIPVKGHPDAQKYLFVVWHFIGILQGIMKKTTSVSLKEMRAILERQANSKFPVKIVTVQGEEQVRFVRGFADPRKDVVMISETSFSIAMKIIEIKEIARLEFASEDSRADWQVVTASWIRTGRHEVTTSK